MSLDYRTCKFCVTTAFTMTMTMTITIKEKVYSDIPDDQTVVIGVLTEGQGGLATHVPLPPPP